MNFDLKFNGSSILSNTSKMPGKSISTSAFNCQTGSKLAEIEGSVCEDCYARKRSYTWPSTVNAMANREQFFEHPDFIPWMVNVLKRDRSDVFRWFDSGDVQSVTQCLAILEVCDQTPEKRHWIPTKEAGYWSKALRMRDLPENVTVRLSAPMKDQQLPVPKWTENTSMVASKGSEAPSGVHTCPAPEQGGKCGDCRACWTREVTTVCYKEH